MNDLAQCFFCGKLKSCPYLIKNSEKENSQVHKMCQICANIYLKDQNQTEKNFDPVRIAEELIKFLNDLPPDKSSETTPCKCGMTEEEFEKDGFFGCPECYTHFEEIVKEQVLPWHHAKQHNGKRPKVKDFDGKLKILKLQLAKAIEIEDYREASKLKKEIDQIIKE